MCDLEAIGAPSIFNVILQCNRMPAMPCHTDTLEHNHNRTISCVRISMSTPGVPTWSIQEANDAHDMLKFVSSGTGSRFARGM